MQLTRWWTRLASRLPLRWSTARAVALWVGRSARRVIVALVGFGLLGVGVVMMVTPGPGLLAIVAGLAVLATEFAWAERALRTAREKADRARRRATGAVRRSKG